MLLGNFDYREFIHCFLFGSLWSLLTSSLFFTYPSDHFKKIVWCKILIKIVHERVWIKIIVICLHPGKISTTKYIQEATQQLIYNTLYSLPNLLSRSLLILPICIIIFSIFLFFILSMHHDERRSRHLHIAYPNILKPRGTCSWLAICQWMSLWHSYIKNCKDISIRSANCCWSCSYSLHISFDFFSNIRSGLRTSHCSYCST